MLDLQVGTVLGTCTITGVLGKGGMGVVYRAAQSRPERTVAVKVLAPMLAEDQQFRHRFEREWNLAASIKHPNIVPIYEVGDVDGLLYVVMHLVDGRDLGRLLVEERGLSPERAIGLLSQAALALDAAHARRLVHRDVKPQNILVASGEGGEPEDFVYLSDFGLTKRLDSASELTAGQFVGTPSYVAPEQVLGLHDLDGRADIYSLGCVLYEALVGKPPFPKETEYATLYAHVNEPPPLLSRNRPGLPQALDEVIATALAKEPAERFSTASELIAASREALQPTAGTAQSETIVLDAVDVEANTGGNHTDEAKAATRRGLALPLPVVGGLALIAVLAAVAAVAWLGMFTPGAEEASQEELLTHIPAAISDDCQAAEATATSGGLATLACSAPQGISVEYTLYADAESVASAYEAARDAQSILPNLGPCGVNDRGETAFRDGGRLFCYRDAERQRWIVWSSPTATTVSAATSSDATELYAFVQERAGPEP